MKDDNQHLDFLISQYVDGCLDGANKKSVEQQMLTNPDARKLYADHREVQELLDDWGNRIPLVDWDQFGRKLESRLAHEAIGGEQRRKLSRWLRPLAAAAALFIAASIGYGWHAWQSPKPVVVSQETPIAALLPHTSVDIADRARTMRASRIIVTVDEDGAHLGTGGAIDPAVVAVAPPGDAAAVESLKESVGYGLEGVARITQPDTISNGTWAVAPPATRPADDKMPEEAFP